jgi:hypothetical protein
VNLLVVLNKDQWKAVNSNRDYPTNEDWSSEQGLLSWDRLCSSCLLKGLIQWTGSSKLRQSFSRSAEHSYFLFMIQSRTQILNRSETENSKPCCFCSYCCCSSYCRQENLENLTIQFFEVTCVSFQFLTIISITFVI